MLCFIGGLVTGGLTGFLLARLLQAKRFTKRTTEDRRSGQEVSFPLRDSMGNVVLVDRRKKADRRLANIKKQ